jgi:hypothetical protein
VRERVVPQAHISNRSNLEPNEKAPENASRAQSAP